MSEVTLTVPELMFVVGTRAMLAGGLALLVAGKLSDRKRKAIGCTLALVGIVSTIPAARTVLSRRTTVLPNGV